MPEGTVFRKGGIHVTLVSICPSSVRLCGVGHVSTRVAGFLLPRAACVTCH